MVFVKPMPKCSLHCGMSTASMPIMLPWIRSTPPLLSQALNNVHVSIAGFFPNFIPRPKHITMGSPTGISTKRVENSRISSSTICQIGTFVEVADVSGRRLTQVINSHVNTHCMKSSSPFANLLHLSAHLWSTRFIAT